MLSFWERESLLKYDVIIVGAGITGLSTAASLKEKHPDLDVLILERGTLPSGASTKNAGFACFGSISELVNDRKVLGDVKMVNLVKRRWDGLQKTITRLGAAKIGLEQKGGYELLSASNAHHLHDIPKVNDLLSVQFENPVFQEVPSKLRDFRFGKTSHLVYNPYEAQLNTGELIRSLWTYCSQLGVKILTGTSVSSIEQKEQFVTITSGALHFSAKAIALCTNAFSQGLIKEKLDIAPGRGMVMLIKPETSLPFEGTFHYEEGYYYFRDFNGKIIFGGGRNIAIDEEQTSEFGINEKIEKKLLEDLRAVIIPGIDFEVEMKWSGIMAFGASKEPIIRQLDKRTYLGARLGGMGVALGSLVGEEIATMISQDHF
ncbi:MAG: FAD-dependent oxidoreductase [Marinoscillum sp.]